MFYRLCTILFVIFLLINPLAIFAIESQFTSFQSYMDVTIPGDTFLNRAYISFEPSSQPNGFAILEKETNRIQPYLTENIWEPNNTQVVAIENSPVRTPITNLFDKDFRTKTSFNFEESSGYSYLTLKLTQPVKTSQISIYLDSNVTLPERAKISSVNQQKQLETIRSEALISSPFIEFPEVTSDTFRVELFHTQPLRLQEIEIGKPTNNILKTHLLWLARPGQTYRIYLNADRPALVPTTEEGSLVNISDTPSAIDPSEVTPNPNYREEDTDKDGIPNKKDNCPALANPDQKDVDNNRKGDVCEDRDGDRIVDGNDNCPTYPNNQQIDTDTNKIGDVCEDVDNDRIPNGKDNCSDISNPDQKDTDQDKNGDVCDQEESRFFERKEFINWIVLLVACVFVGILGFLVLKSSKSQAKSESEIISEEGNE